MSYRVSADFELPQSGNYFVRHWRGHLSLPVSYWVNGFLLVGIVTLLSLALIQAAESSDLSLQALAAIYLTNLFLAGLMWLWSVVGIWRSAGFHEQRGGSAGWASFARVMIVLGTLATFGQSQNTALAAEEYTRLALGDDPLGEPAQLTVEAQQRSLLVEGVLTLGTAERFEALLQQEGDLRLIVLQSPGGRSLEAERMAKAIASRGLDTSVKQDCLSACTLVLLAGRERSATPAAQIGFHQPSFPGLTPEEQQILTSDLRQLYEHAGVTSEFLDQALQAPPESMWYPSHDELIGGNVLNTTKVVYSRKAAEARKSQLARYLRASADELNAAGRVRLDEITTRTGAEARENVLTIRNVIGVPAASLDIAAGKQGILASVTKEACDHQPTRQAIEAGAVVVFSYRDSDGQQVFDLKVDQCGESESL